jgi:hypothetical protein
MRLRFAPFHQQIAPSLHGTGVLFALTAVFIAWARLKSIGNRT